jgi:hypothetical protein
MQLTVLLSICVSLATTSLSNGGEFSQVRDLPALKLGATDLDAILLETHAFIDAANGPEDSDHSPWNGSIHFLLFRFHFDFTSRCCNRAKQKGLCNSFLRES